MKGKDYEYVIEFKNPALKYADIISLLLCLLTIIPFTYFLFFAPGVIETYILTLAVIILQLVYNYYKKKKGKSINHNYAFAICFIAWITIPYKSYLLGMLYLIAMITENQAKVTPGAGIDSEGVTINSLPQRKFKWQNLSNVIIKDNLLTIDRKNNRIIQKETESDIPSQLQEEFNKYCKHRLRNHELSPEQTT